MPFKHTMLFDYPGGTTEAGEFKRGGGWSESMIADTAYPAANDAFGKVRQARRELLPKHISIVGYRISDLEKKIGSKLFHVGLPGTFDDVTEDIPQLSIRGSGYSAQGNKLVLTLRGVPDQVAANGALAAQGDMRKKFNAYVSSLAPFYQLCRKLDANVADIEEVSVLGVVKLKAPLAGLAVDGFVNLLKVRTLTKFKHLGKYRVVAKEADNQQFTVIGWLGGNGGGGRARIADTVKAFYPETMNIDFVTSRKVGREFFSSAGRR